jgi:hypothetical protein
LLIFSSLRGLIILLDGLSLFCRFDKNAPSSGPSI